LIFKTRRKLLSNLIVQKPTPTTIFNPVKKKIHESRNIILKHARMLG
jgi:hypothetical protein